MPQGYKQCANHVSNPFCKGEGSKPYIKYVKAPWAWGAKVKKDKNGFYFTGESARMCLRRQPACCVMKVA